MLLAAQKTINKIKMATVVDILFIVTSVYGANFNLYNAKMSSKILSLYKQQLESMS